MRVIGTRRDASVIPPNVEEVFDPKDTNEVHRQSDFVLCSLPSRRRRSGSWIKTALRDEITAYL
jgi:hypothetical protein